VQPRRHSICDSFIAKNRVVHDIGALSWGICAHQAAADKARRRRTESDEAQLRFAAPLCTHPGAKVERWAGPQRGEVQQLVHVHHTLPGRSPPGAIR
jgi:hypothetical protein